LLTTDRGVDDDNARFFSAACVELIHIYFDYGPPPEDGESFSEHHQVEGGELLWIAWLFDSFGALIGRPPSMNDLPLSDNRLREPVDIELVRQRIRPEMGPLGVSAAMAQLFTMLAQLSRLTSDKVTGRTCEIPLLLKRYENPA
jgi:hypothetical protein